MRKNVPRALVASTGCKLNQAEADLWKAYLAKKGYEIADGMDGKQVELCLVTTCTVTKAADRSSVALIRRLHRAHPGAQIKVTGCGAVNVPLRLSALPGVCQIIGYEEKERLIGELSYGDKGVDAVSIERNRAFLRVGEGCDRRCAYCIVSRMRGPVRSKPAGKIVSELAFLREAGFGEVVLAALNLGLWGKEKQKQLTDLLTAIQAHKGPLPRIRLTSLEPDTITPELVEAVARDPRICPHLHIPLQSGADKMLKKMNRPYTTAEFSGLVDEIHNRIPDANIGTDVITSLPEEDEESFAKTLYFLKSLPIGYLHAFTFSARKGTPMYEERDRIPRNPRERTRILRELGKEKSMIYRKRFVGRQRVAVLLSPTRALSDNYIDVRIPETSIPVRSLAMLEITEVSADKTTGRLV